MLSMLLLFRMSDVEMESTEIEDKLKDNSITDSAIETDRKSEVTGSAMEGSKFSEVS